MKYKLLLPLIIAAAFFQADYTYAATPPDSCFAFNAGTNTITDYYDHEGNNPANPACTRDVDIPGTIGGVPVTVIGLGAFYRNDLTAVTIPNTVTSIGNSAFSDNQLSEISLPSGVTSIAVASFSNNQLTNVTIPNSVTSISYGAFSDNIITNVTILNAATSMQHDSFAQNPISSMTIGSSTYTEQTPTIESACFALAGSTVTDYYQASPLIARDNGVLCGRDVSIPNTATSIGTNAFRSNSLSSVTIPGTVTSIGSFAFARNYLSSIVIPASVNTINYSAFALNRLTSVTIPSSVTSMDFGVFGVQSDWGSDIESGRNGAPNMYSDNPDEVQDAYDTIRYVRLYTEDPSNPNNLVNDFMSENYWSGYDVNSDGVDNSLGGHIVNPASLEVQYTNQSNASLQTSQIFTGMQNDGYLSNYLVSQGPLLPVPVDPDNPTPAEQLAIDEALSVYYRIGDSVTIDPPAISGYITPAPQTFVLGAADNTFSYVYAQAAGSSSGGSAPSSPDDEELADTGVSTVLYMAAAIALMSAGAAIVTRRV